MTGDSGKWVVKAVVGGIMPFNYYNEISLDRLEEIVKFPQSG
jgi:hypothetical protein